MTIEHILITDPEIHEPKGASTASIDQVYLSNGSGSGAWTDQVSPFNPASLVIEELLHADSVALSQQPSALDVPIQVEFGPAQLTIADPVMISVDGTITINEAGTYRFDFAGHYGRTGGAGVSILFLAEKVNGVFQHDSITAKLDDADVLLPMSQEAWATLPAGTVLTYELYRDSAGNNSGGLFTNAPSLAGWPIAPSAAVTVSRLTTQ